MHASIHYHEIALMNDDEGKYQDIEIISLVHVFFDECIDS